jgi:hypothetical protein
VNAAFINGSHEFAHPAFINTSPCPRTSSTHEYSLKDSVIQYVNQMHLNRRIHLRPPDWIYPQGTGMSQPISWPKVEKDESLIDASQSSSEMRKIFTDMKRSPYRSQSTAGSHSQLWYSPKENLCEDLGRAVQLTICGIDPAN